MRSFAHEPALPTIIAKKYFAEKETITRSNLARLMKTTHQHGHLDYGTMAKESTIARNKIMLEHVMQERNMRGWKDEILAEIHQEQR